MFKGEIKSNITSTVLDIFSMYLNLGDHKIICKKINSCYLQIYDTITCRPTIQIMKFKTCVEKCCHVVKKVQWQYVRWVFNHSDKNTKTTKKKQSKNDVLMYVWKKKELEYRINKNKNRLFHLSIFSTPKWGPW